MRKELARRTRHRFEEHMAQRLPWFERVSNAPYKGTLLFRWELDVELSFFVLFLPHDKADCFTLELAWTTGGGWPADHVGQDPDDEPKDGAVRIRLSLLWDNKDPWWEIVPEPSVFDDIEAWLADPPPVDELTSRTEELVADALDRLLDEGMSYLRTVAARRGRELPAELGE